MILQGDTFTSSWYHSLRFLLLYFSNSPQNELILLCLVVFFPIQFVLLGDYNIRLALAYEMGFKYCVFSFILGCFLRRFEMNLGEVRIWMGRGVGQVSQTQFPAEAITEESGFGWDCSS